jgi:hypothetical protein
MMPTRRDHVAGNGLRTLAAVLLGGTAAVASLEALIADYQYEWRHAASAMLRGRIRARMIAAFWITAVAHLAAAATRAPRAKFVGTFALTIVWSVGVGLVLHLVDSSKTWPDTVDQACYNFPGFFATVLYNVGYPRDTQVSERLRVYVQASIIWGLLAFAWTVWMNRASHVTAGPLAFCVMAGIVLLWRMYARERRQEARDR